MIDVEIPTTDGRTITLTHHTEPEPELKPLLERLQLELPAQPPPKNHRCPNRIRHPRVVQTFEWVAACINQ